MLDDDYEDQPKSYGFHRAPPVKRKIWDLKPHCQGLEGALNALRYTASDDKPAVE